MTVHTLPSPKNTTSTLDSLELITRDGQGTNPRSSEKTSSPILNIYLKAEIQVHFPTLVTVNRQLYFTHKHIA